MAKEKKEVEPVAAETVAPVVVKEEAKPAIDATTLTFLIYTLYKMNIIHRTQVKEFLNFIKDGKHPENITTYLLDEVKKI